MDTVKHNAQSPTSTQNAVANTTQKTVRNQDIIQRNVPYAAMITLQTTRDVLFTET